MKLLLFLYSICIVMTIQLQKILTDVLENQDKNLTNATKSEDSNRCKTAKCTESNFCIHNKSIGCITVTSNDSHMIHQIKVPNETSVILFRLVLMNKTDITQGYIFMEFYEFKQKRVRWEFTAGKSIKERSYASLHSELTVHVKAEGDWKDIIFTYKALEFEIQTKHVAEDSGVFAPSSLQANTLILYHLTPLPGKWNESSIMFTIEIMIADEIIGEYMLIGSGAKPFAGPPALFLTGRITKPEKYYVVTDDAYIAFFARSSSQKSRFKINWKRSGNRLHDPSEDIEETSISDSVLQAVQICFYNSSIIQEFNCTECNEGPLPKFRSKIAELANDYAKEKQFRHEIKAKHIKLFRISSIIKSEDYPDGVLYIMVTIIQEYDKKLAVFRWNQMQEILEQYYNYDKENNHALLGFKVGKCLQSGNYYWWFTAMAVILMFCIFLLIGIWILSYNMMWKSRKKKDDKESTDTQWQPDYNSEINENWILRKRPMENNGNLTANKRIWKEWKTGDPLTYQEPQNENTGNLPSDQSGNNNEETLF